MKTCNLSQSISLTPEATYRALALNEKDVVVLRLYLEGKGCDGFFYGVCLDQNQEDDLVFSHSYKSESRKVDIVVDPKTWEFVQGSTIDWVDDSRGQGFLVTNPSHRAYRGKFFKREVWQRKLAGKSDVHQRGKDRL